MWMKRGSPGTRVGEIKMDIHTGLSNTAPHVWVYELISWTYSYATGTLISDRPVYIDYNLITTETYYGHVLAESMCSVAAEGLVAILGGCLTKVTGSLLKPSPVRPPVRQLVPRVDR